MSMLILAAAFVLASGAKVEIHPSADFSEPEARQVGLQLATEAWADFCTRQSDKSCGPGQYYGIEITLKREYCMISIMGRPPDAPAGHLFEGIYECAVVRGKLVPIPERFSSM